MFCIKNIQKGSDFMRNLSIAEAARLMNKCPQYVRIGIQRKLLPFGTAIPGPNGKNSYHISPAKFNDYMGAEVVKLDESM